MRRILIALIIVMFVGGHGLSSVVVSVFEGSTEVSVSNFNTPAGQPIITVGNAVITDFKGGEETLAFQGVDHLGIAAEKVPDGSHCTAHCGISAALIVADVSNEKWNLDLPLAPANVATASNEHFRPPIV